MDPEYLPHFFLLIAGVGAMVVAFQRLSSRKWRSALALLALGVVLGGVSFLVGSLASKKAAETWRLPESMRPRALTPATHPERVGKEPTTMTLALGGVHLRIAASDRYEVSVHDETGLTVESDSSGLLVSCDVAADARHFRTSPLVATIRQNTITYIATGIRTLRPDPHTILIFSDDKVVFRAHHLRPRTLEIDGEIPLEAGVVRMTEGIAWAGHFIPPGPVDLTAEGVGRLDFQPSGLVRIVPR